MWKFGANTVSILERNGFSYTSDLTETQLPNYHEIDGRRSQMIDLPVQSVLDDLIHVHDHVSARKTILTNAQLLEHDREEFEGIHAYGGCLPSPCTPRRPAVRPAS